MSLSGWLTIDAFFVAGRSVPLAPCFILARPQEALFYSCELLLICLFVFGSVKTTAPISGAFEVLLTGAVAAVAAFGVAHLIQ